MKKLLSISLIFLFLIACSEDKEESKLDITLLGGSYLGESFPGEAEVFLNGLTDNEHQLQNVVFSPDGKEFYFTRQLIDGDSSKIFVSKLAGDNWSKPEVVSFSGKFNDSDPFITSGGNKLYFVSDRPRPGETDPYFDYNIWVCSRKDSGWSEPEYIKEINSTDDEFYPTLTGDNVLYFSSAREGSGGYWDIYKSTLTGGKFSRPVKPDSVINSSYRDWDPCISSDGNYLLFVSDRSGGYGGGDIYISYKKNGKWSEVKNIGNLVNTNEFEYCPKISYDGNYLFFTRLTANNKDFYQEKALDTRDPFDYDFLPKNGRALVYWIPVDSLSVIK